MRPIGYSTGALAPGDVPRALGMLATLGACPVGLPSREPAARAVELSALRLAELAPLAALIPSLDLSAFAHVSVHAPSRFSAEDEPRVVDVLAEAVPEGWPIVVHPDTLHDLARWRRLGRRLLVENMDRRKATGRTVRELGRVFEALPDASFCLDVGHAHQVDRTMNDASFLLDALGARLGQLHVSEVTTAGRHDPLSRSAVLAFRAIAAAVPADVPIILESPAAGAEMAAQMALAAEALSPPRPPRPGT